MLLFPRKRESNVFNNLWIPRTSRRMTNHEFMDGLYLTPKNDFTNSYE